MLVIHVDIKKVYGVKKGMVKMNRRKRRRRQVKFMLFSIGVLLCLGAFAYIQMLPKVADEVTIEAGTAEVDIEDFIIDKGENIIINIKGENIINKGQDASFITDIKSLDLSTPGTYDIQIAMGGRVYSSKLNVVDTTPPKATAIKQETWVGERIEPSAFIKDIEDATQVKVSYLKEPDFHTPGEQSVILLLKDKFGNTSEIDSVLLVKEDTEPPQINGVTDKIVRIGDTISYRKGVTVTDNKDEEVELQIDSSQVNLKEEGTYEVIYTAIDSSGNKATKTAEIIVKALVVTEDDLNELADDVLAQIRREGMTQKELAKAIYTWTKNHIAYTGSSDKSDWMAEAYRGFKNGVGDCFTYFCVSQALLNRAGINNIGLTRMGGRTRHYWSLINVGEGWYHFDATPHKDHRDSFYLTETEVRKLTEIRGNNYYVYDPATINVTPVE